MVRVSVSVGSAEIQSFENENMEQSQIYFEVLTEILKVLDVSIQVLVGPTLTLVLLLEVNLSLRMTGIVENKQLQKFLRSKIPHRTRILKGCLA